MEHTEGPLDAFAPLAGHWAGTSEGVFGTATVDRTCEPVLDGRFFRVATRSTSEREVHEDIGFHSFDHTAGTLVLREFHNEGYVNAYRELASAGGALVFESEHIENPEPATLRARLSTWQEGGQLRETLELASDDGPFRICVDIRLMRR
jgi:hypothetical protein